jgi:predicted TIM-barrel fold metal-dependent hydrolase
VIVDGHVHVGRGRKKSLEPRQLINLMDDNGVDKAIVCPVDEYIAIYNRQGNDYILDAVKEFPDRLFGFATVNPWYELQALEELHRAFGEGLHGLKLHSCLQGFHITDNIIYPIVELAVEQKKPMYFHTGTMVCAEPFQLAYLAQRYPTGKFIMGHAGASDFWNDVIPAVQTSPNLLIETSKTTPVTIMGMIEGDPSLSERVIFGSNLPTSSYTLELAKVREVIKDTSLLEKILGKNVMALL